MHWTLGTAAPRRAAFSSSFLTSSFSCSQTESNPAPAPVTHTVRRTDPQKGNHGNIYWKVLVLWKNDSNVALWRYNWRRNLSHCMFRVQRKRLPTKRAVDRLMAMGWLDVCDWSYDWYVLCCSRFRRPLTRAVRLTDGPHVAHGL